MFWVEYCNSNSVFELCLFIVNLELGSCWFHSFIIFLELKFFFLQFKIQGSANPKKEVPFSLSRQRPRIDPISNMRTGSRGFGLPPPGKFRSGHLSGVIPARTIPNDVDESVSASDNDMTSDSEEEVYGGRYSLDSSPQDDRIPTNATAQRFTSERRPEYASDNLYSGDVSSSRETIGRGRVNVAQRVMTGAHRYPVGSNGYTEDESDDSVSSSEFSTTQAGSVSGGLHHARGNASEGYASSVPSRVNAVNASKKVILCFNIRFGFVFKC